MGTRNQRENNALWTSEALQWSQLLAKDDLAAALSFCNACLTCEREEHLHESILGFADLIGAKFVLYAYMKSSYDSAGYVCLKNLSNPVAWMEEYAERNYIEHDPVRRELEVWLSRGETHGVFAWDAYDRKLSPIEEKIIERRTHWGLRTGFSAFCDSPRHDAVFLVSFASRRKEPPSQRAMLMGKLIVAHLNRCRKRLDLSSVVARLTPRERTVAKWLVDGKTNSEIAQILDVTEATAKYHVANILAKLEAASRQVAVSILIAERCLA
ncbi:MAG: LuxR family transcriptional regulator [Deltaproteobacteria bacterium]|nr:LuxR family transcriptional regulator [Deltaproteobacteria bacterium]